MAAHLLQYTIYDQGSHEILSRVGKSAMFRAVRIWYYFQTSNGGYGGYGGYGGSSSFLAFVVVEQQLFLFLYPNCQTIIDVICMFWRENQCFGAKTKTILGSINKNGFLNHPTHQPETNKWLFCIKVLFVIGQLVSLCPNPLESTPYI